MATNEGSSRISQIAMVVHDLDESMKALYETLGWGPWTVFELAPPLLHSTQLHGESVEFSFLAAECEVPPGVTVELVQPLRGPSIYREWLDQHGEGVQHIACRMKTQGEADDFRKEWAGRGIDVLMAGRIGQTIEFEYLDTQPMLKFILETGSGESTEVVPIRTYPPTM